MGLRGPDKKSCTLSGSVLLSSQFSQPAAVSQRGKELHMYAIYGDIPIKCTFKSEF